MNSLLRNLRARRLAAGAKRLDLCAAQFAHLLHLSPTRSLEGLTCLEIGSGWVLTHALVFHLLGARRVTATDISPEARPAAARNAVLSSVPSIVRDILSPFSDHEALRERLDRLRAWTDYSFAGLEKLGIFYEAPVDLSKARPRAAADFIYSNSVLEHVPVNDVASVLNNLRASLTEGGHMIHAIHLEDHRDFARRPFDFLSIPASRYTAAEQSAHGNRIRAGAWRAQFDALAGCKTETLYQWRRPATLLPSSVSADISSQGVDDTTVSHLAFHTTCQNSPK